MMLLEQADTGNHLVRDFPRLLELRKFFSILNRMVQPNISPIMQSGGFWLGLTAHLHPVSPLSDADGRNDVYIAVDTRCP
jgi:hypothetical protein